ncbi:MAG: hypothetical protein PHP08_00645 [Candidatus Dojkabacteria bacterium]|nr:hypothetical protein [Candidatus Dojkabacteria bacterium]
MEEMSDVKIKRCIYCGEVIEYKNTLYCSVECKGKHEEQERKHYIQGIDKNWK